MRYCVPAAGAMLLLVPVPAGTVLVSYIPWIRGMGKGLEETQPC